MLDDSPFALPLPVQMLKEERVPVSSIPLGLLLNRYVGDLDVRVNDTKSSSNKLPAVRTAGSIGGRERDLSGNAPSLLETPSLMHAPLPSTNKGKNPNSRRYIRGVLHPRPKSLYLGAIATFLIFWLVPASVISAVLLILSSEMSDRFAWVSPQLLWIQAALILVGALYLLYGLSGSCQICNQRLFIYRSHLKNSQAHHVFGLGYVIPLCLHLMVFRWFRCTHCGTPIRLKK